MPARRRGTLFVFVAAVLYSIGGLCIKFIPWSGMAVNGGRTAIVLRFTAPIFVILFSIFCFHKRPGRLDLAACAAVLGGILFFFVDKISPGEMMGNAIALLSGVAYAGVPLLREMPNSDTISSVFWGDVISAAIVVVSVVIYNVLLARQPVADRQ